eukprot:2909414-Rhodomonas_salina.1
MSWARGVPAPGVHGSGTIGPRSCTPRCARELEPVLPRALLARSGESASLGESGGEGTSGVAASIRSR